MKRRKTNVKNKRDKFIQYFTEGTETVKDIKFI